MEMADFARVGRAATLVQLVRCSPECETVRPTERASGVFAIRTAALHRCLRVFRLAAELTRWARDDVERGAAFRLRLDALGAWRFVGLT